VVAFYLNQIAWFAIGYILCWMLYMFFVLNMARSSSQSGDLRQIAGFKDAEFSSEEIEFIQENLFFFTYHRFAAPIFNSINSSFSLGAYAWIALAVYAHLWVQAAVLVCIVFYSWNRIEYVLNLYGMLRRGAAAGHRRTAERFELMQRIIEKQRQSLAKLSASI